MLHKTDSHSPGNTVMWNTTHYKTLLQKLSAVLIQLTWPTLETTAPDIGALNHLRFTRNQNQLCLILGVELC